MMHGCDNIIPEKCHQNFTLLMDHPTLLFSFQSFITLHSLHHSLFSVIPITSKVEQDELCCTCGKLEKSCRVLRRLSESISLELFMGCTVVKRQFLISCKNLKRQGNRVSHIFVVDIRLFFFSNQSNGQLVFIPDGGCN